MKKENIYKFLYIISIMLIVGFIIRLLIDYIKYDNINNSAPFYNSIIERLFEFILPSMLLFIVAKILKKKYMN